MSLEAKQGYIKSPTTLEEYIHNAHFQLENVIGWMEVGDYCSAEIKAGCLVEALQKIVALQKGQTS